MYMVKSKKNLTYKKKHNNSKKRKSILKKKTIKKINRNKNKSMKQKGGMEMGSPAVLIPPALYLGYLGYLGLTEIGSRRGRAKYANWVKSQKSARGSVRGSQKSATNSATGSATGSDN